MRSLDAGNRQKIASMRTAQQRMIDHEVDQAVRFGRFRADHPHEAARAVVTMHRTARMVAPGGPLAPEQVARQYVGFALDLMRNRDVADTSSGR